MERSRGASLLDHVGRAAVAVLTLLSACRPLARTSGSVARRVVSLSPSTTEGVAAIGARTALVGRSRYCDFPPEVASLPIVGGYVDPNYEAILALAPDLVVGARGPGGPDIVERLEAHGIAVYFPVTESFDGICEMLRGLGQRTGHTRDAESVVAGLRRTESDVARAVASVPRVRALLLFGVTPIVAAGPGSFADEMLARAGGANVVRVGGPYPTVSLEALLVLNPDIVLDAAWGESSARITVDSPGWQDLAAVRAGKVVSLDDEVVLRPGPRIGDGLRVLARALHPELAIP